MSARSFARKRACARRKETQLVRLAHDYVDRQRGRFAAPGFGAKKLWTSAALAGRRASGAVFRRVVFFLAAGFLASPDDDDRGRAPLDRARGFGASGAGGGGDRAAPRRVARQSMSWRSTSALTSGGSSLSVSRSTSAPSMPASTGAGAGGSGEVIAGALPTALTHAPALWRARSALEKNGAVIQ